MVGAFHDCMRAFAFLVLVIEKCTKGPKWDEAKELKGIFLDYNKDFYSAVHRILLPLDKVFD